MKCLKSLILQDKHNDMISNHLVTRVKELFAMLSICIRRSFLCFDFISAYRTIITTSQQKPMIIVCRVPKIIRKRTGVGSKRIFYVFSTSNLCPNIVFRIVISSCILVLVNIGLFMLNNSLLEINRGFFNRFSYDSVCATGSKCKIIVKYTF